MPSPASAATIEGRRIDDSFLERPILNSPYSYPARHWELDADGQPPNRIIAAVCPSLNSDIPAVP